MPKKRQSRWGKSMKNPRYLFFHLFTSLKVMRWKKQQAEVLTEYGLLMGANSELFLCFCDFQVDEWIEQNVYPLQDKTVNLLELIDQLTARRTWPRRPIP